MRTYDSTYAYSESHGILAKVVRTSSQPYNGYGRYVLKVLSSNTERCGDSWSFLIANKDESAGIEMPLVVFFYIHFRLFPEGGIDLFKLTE